MAGDLIRRVMKLEGDKPPSDPSPMVDRPPSATREEWLSRRAADLTWTRFNGAWVLAPTS
jgi:hypothetical protein